MFESLNRSEHTEFVPLTMDIVKHHQFGFTIVNRPIINIQPVDLRQLPPLHGRRVAPAVVLQEGFDVLPAAEVHDEQCVVDVGTQRRGPGPAVMQSADLRNKSSP